MSTSFNSNKDNESSGNYDELNELRNIIIGPEQEQIQKIEQKIEVIDKEQLSEVLPESLILSSKKDNKLYKALSPTIEESLEYSIKKNPKTIAEAIFPIIGPAIRKSIYNSLKELRDSINLTIEQKFNLGWRIESFRTGRPYSEVVLEHSLLFRVEQIFLINNETGLLIQHVSLENINSENTDLISGMLTAIQDFVRDSFGSTDEEIESFNVGEYTIIVEKGPSAYIAAVVRGNPPGNLKVLIQEVLESLHLRYANEFSNYDGNTINFEQVIPELESCLVSESTVEEKKYSKLWLLLSLIPIIILILLSFRIYNNSIWSDYIDTLRSEPGIIVTDFGRNNGKLFVSGLIDPIATDPEKLLSDKVEPNDVESFWQPFISLDEKILIKKLNRELDPPNEIKFMINDGLVTVEGNSDMEWLDTAKKTRIDIPGISNLDFTKVNLIELEEYGELINEIQSTYFMFDRGKYTISEKDKLEVELLAQKLNKLLGISNHMKKNMTLQIIGRADATGNEENNIWLSSMRALNVEEYLVLHGLKIKKIDLVGLGSKAVGNSFHDNENTARNVSFKIVAE